MKIQFRPMLARDVGRVPQDCHGGDDALRQRIDDLGAAAILAFDGDQHVGQLQFRRYDPQLRSLEGIWHPDYWGDFGEHAPRLPASTLNVFCYHVGQLTAGDARSPAYQGQGIGLALLDALLDWADAEEFSAIVAKHTPDDRAVMGFMGGQPEAAYVQRGFSPVASWIDTQLASAVLERALVPRGSKSEQVARVGCCVKLL